MEEDKQSLNEIQKRIYDKIDKKHKIDEKIQKLSIWSSSQVKKLLLLDKFYIMGEIHSLREFRDYLLDKKGGSN